MFCTRHAIKRAKLSVHLLLILPAKNEDTSLFCGGIEENNQAEEVASAGCQPAARPCFADMALWQHSTRCRAA